MPAPPVPRPPASTAPQPAAPTPPRAAGIPVPQPPTPSRPLPVPTASSEAPEDEAEPLEFADAEVITEIEDVEEIAEDVQPLDDLDDVQPLEDLDDDDASAPPQPGTPIAVESEPSSTADADFSDLAELPEDDDELQVETLDDDEDEPVADERRDPAAPPQANYAAESSLASDAAAQAIARHGYSDLRLIASEPFGRLWSARTTEGESCLVACVPTDSQEEANKAAQAARVTGRLDVPGLPEYRSDHDAAIGTLIVTAHPPGAAMAPSKYSTDDAVALLRDLCSILRHAHGAGVVHGWVVPEAIWIDQRGRTQPWLTRFGWTCAHNRGAADARTEDAPVAPEVQLGGRPDITADVYGVGVIAHFLFTGEAPGVPPKDGELPEAIPSPLRPLLTRTLAARPDQRYPDIDALDAALATVQGTAGLRTPEHQLPKGEDEVAGRIPRWASAVAPVFPLLAGLWLVATWGRVALDVDHAGPAKTLPTAALSADHAAAADAQSRTRAPAPAPREEVPPVAIAVAGTGATDGGDESSSATTTVDGATTSSAIEDDTGTTGGEILAHDEVGEGDAAEADAAPSGDRSSRKRRAAELVRQASDASSAGNRKKASQLLHRALGFDSRNAEALAGLSDLAFDAGAYANALKYAKRAVSASPRNAGYRIRLGDAYVKTLRYAEARQHYEAAERLGSRAAADRLRRLDARVGSK